MTNVNVYNTTAGPVAVSREGHVVGAHQHRADVDDTDPVADAAIAAGLLIVVAPPATSPPIEDGEEADVDDTDPVAIEAPKSTRKTSRARTSAAPTTEEE